MKKPHPLRLWLTHNRMQPYAFAAMIGVQAAVIYRHLRGAVDPRLSTMRKIERATGGLVSLRRQANWLEENDTIRHKD